MAPELGEALRGQRLFLTGGTGFFGCWLLETLLQANAVQGLGASVTVLTRDPDRFVAQVPHLASNPAVTLCPGDLATFPLPDGPFPFVVHAAADVQPTADPAVAEQGMERVLALARARGTERLLLVSSGAVYGRQPTDLPLLTEDHPLQPTTGYGEGKCRAEALARAAADLCIPIARCFAFVGPYLPLDGSFAVGNFLRAALADQPIVIQGDGTPLRSYLYAADLAHWLWTILLRGEGGRAYHVGSEEALSIRELADRVRRACQSRSEVLVRQTATPGTLPERYIPSTQRARTELGLAPTIAFDDALARTAHWLRNGPMFPSGGVPQEGESCLSNREA